MVQPRRPLASTSLALLLLSGCAEQPPAPSEGSTAQALVTTDAAGAEVLLRHSSARAIVAQPDGLFRLELPRRELADASHALHEELGRCGGFMLDRPSGGATPLGRVSTRALQVAYTIDNAATVSALLAPLQENKLRETIQGLADFPTRFHDTEEGYAAALWIRDRWQAHAAGRADVTVQLVEHDYTPQPSISLTIAGSKAPEELVILGGHMDSINPRGGAAPGADDNASGIAVLDEVIRTAMLLDYRPERTVVFYAYAAEEIGLVGSAQIAEAAAERELAVAGVLQLDMTNFSSAPTPYLALVTDYTDAALNAYARTLIETYVKLPWQDTECGYACSDHASWQQSGFPVHYVHEARISEGNGQIHTDQDTLELSDGTAQHSLYFAQYSAAFMAELAKGAVSECDAARPCPAGQQCEAGSCLPLPGSAGAGGGGAGGTSGGTGSELGGSAGSSTLSGGGAAGAGVSAGSGAAGTSALAGTGGAGGTLVAATPTAGPPAGDAEGCACRAPAGRSRSGSSVAWLALLMLVASRRMGRDDSVRFSCADPACSRRQRASCASRLMTARMRRPPTGPSEPRR